MPIDFGTIFKKNTQRSIAEILQKVAELGTDFIAPHCIYVAFDTRHPQTSIPQEEANKYPKLMTIVLEKQFYDMRLIPTDPQDITTAIVEVKVSFRGILRTIAFPIEAIVGINDTYTGMNLVLEQEDPEYTQRAPEPEPAPEIEHKEDNVIPVKFGKKA